MLRYYKLCFLTELLLFFAPSHMIKRPTIKYQCGHHCQWTSHCFISLFDVTLSYCSWKIRCLKIRRYSVIATMNAELYSKLKKEKAIHSGMIPKLDNCFNSLSRGVQKNTNRPPQHVAKWWCYLHDNRVIKCPHSPLREWVKRILFILYSTTI
jgi:hypothetical protein